MLQMRPETGVMVFDGDWPGIFIRGDNCINVKNILESLVLGIEQPETYDIDIQDLERVRSLIRLFESCLVNSRFYKEKDVQRLKYIHECLRE